jgi:putative Holliday junction resolvase
MLRSAKANCSLGIRYSSTPATIYNPDVAVTEEERCEGRILALDVGKKRIGLAVSDELRITAQGLDTLQRTRIRDDLRALDKVIKDLNVTLLLVGRPLHMSGSESRQSEYTEEFAVRLAAHTETAVVHWDERLTSAEAERVLRQAGTTLVQRRKAVDRMAAVLLLESYLGYLGTETQTAARGGIG